jgi:hypothetical protein
MKSFRLASCAGRPISDLHLEVKARSAAFALRPFIDGTSSSRDISRKKI